MIDMLAFLIIILVLIGLAPDEIANSNLHPPPNGDGISSSRANFWRAGDFGVTMNRSANYRHGMSLTSTYTSWAAMKKRCSNPKNRDYKYYGGKGIKVCERWQNFNNFWSDMGTKPSPKHTIERKERDKDYSPDNCIWITQVEQVQNSSHNNYITFDGKTMTLTKWAEFLGMKRTTLSGRIVVKRWPLDRALTTKTRPLARKIWRR